MDKHNGTGNELHVGAEFILREADTVCGIVGELEARVRKLGSERISRWLTEGLCSVTSGKPNVGKLYLVLSVVTNVQHGLSNYSPVFHCSLR